MDNNWVMKLINGKHARIPHHLYDRILVFKTPTDFVAQKVTYCPVCLSIITKGTRCYGPGFETHLREGEGEVVNPANWVHRTCLDDIYDDVRDSKFPWLVSVRKFELKNPHVHVSWVRVRDVEKDPTYYGLEPLEEEYVEDIDDRDVHEDRGQQSIEAGLPQL